jgi:hypothetical protein
MIAIAVVASLVVYAWIMGYIGGTTSKAGQAIQIQSYAGQNGYLTIYVQNVGQGSVNLKRDGSVYINDVLHSITDSPSGVPATDLIPINVGETVEIVTDYPYTPGEQVRIKIVTVEGTFMETTGTTGSGGQGTVYTIAASPGQSDGAHGYVSPSGTIPVNPGASQPFTIIPDTGYQIANVVVDGAPQGAISSYTFNNVNENGHTISATFSIITFTIDVNAGSGGSISPTGPVTVNYGANQAFSITAGSGYHIVSVSVDGVSQGAITSYTFTNVQADHEISATFALTIVQHKVSFAQTGSAAAVTVSYQIDGGSVQTGTAPFDVMVTVGHTISYTYPATVAGATGVHYSLTNTNPASPQTMGSSDIPVSGTYKTLYYVTFAVTPAGAGTTTASNWFDAGVAGQSILASPSGGGYTFSSWSANPSGSVTFANSGSASTTMTVNAPSTVTATFTVALTPHYVDTNNLVHEYAQIGTHSSFASMKDVGAYDTLTEASYYGTQRLTLEVQFTGVTNYASYGHVEIKTGAFSSDNEGLYVYYWNGYMYTPLGGGSGQLTASTTNTFTVAMTGQTLELRFSDGTQYGDTTASTWQIDYARLVA